jgi:rubrerythrin
MEDFGDPELEDLLNRLRSGIERRRSLVASNEDIAGTHESLDGEWGEWMCQECGVFLREHQRRCVRCGASRI